MLFGVMVSILNHTFFKRTLNIVVEFIPQIIFLLGLFGYLCIMTFHKWVWFGSDPSFDLQHGNACAPSVLITFINMVLLTRAPFNETDPNMPCNPYMYAYQYEIQTALVLISLLMVPIMLIPKPIILNQQFKARQRMRAQRSAQPEDAEQGETAVSNEPEEEFEFSEVFIEQAIHTIEYVLGSVSHTASYLRLWALSLAHGQLSEVLWNMVLKIGLSSGSTSGCIMLYLIFAFWAAATVAILVLMEGLSAFLHTLRLHWVEFQSKFYKGEGYAFEPFAFKQIVEGEDEEGGG